MKRAWPRKAAFIKGVIQDFFMNSPPSYDFRTTPLSRLSAQDFDTSLPPSPHLSMLFFCTILVKEASPCIKHKYLRREQH